MPQFGLFDYQKQLALLEKAGDPLLEINQMIDWEPFRALIEQAREKPRICPAGGNITVAVRLKHGNKQAKHKNRP